MSETVGVRFRKIEKIYNFDTDGQNVKKGDHVIVETSKGVEYGTVTGSPVVTDDDADKPQKPILRIATEKDDEHIVQIEKKEKEAYRICKEKIAESGLEMKLVSAEYTFDNSKIIFYFTADGRVDFRELVKELASVFKMRIELRQIGVRDETRMVGGIGMCGRSLCCATYLSDFVPVSIKMAKEQNLSLNPAKISGICGRLMCCLKSEEEAYEDLNAGMPSVGDMVKTNDGLVGEVASVNVLRQKVRVIIEQNDEREIKEYEGSKLTLCANKKQELEQTSREENETKEDIENGREETPKEDVAKKDIKTKTATNAAEKKRMNVKPDKDDRSNMPYENKKNKNAANEPKNKNFGKNNNEGKIAGNKPGGQKKKAGQKNLDAWGENASKRQQNNKRKNSRAGYGKNNDYHKNSAYREMDEKVGEKNREWQNQNQNQRKKTRHQDR